MSATLSWIVSGLMAIALVILAPWLAARTLNAPHLAHALRLGALLLLLGGVNGAQTGTLSGFEAFKVIARINVVVGLLNFPLLIAGAVWGGLNGCIIALVLNLVANCALNHFAVRELARENKIPISYRHIAAEMPLLWNFSLPLTLLSLTIMPAHWVTSTFLARSIFGYEGMGIFSAASQWRNLIVLVPTMMGSVALPMLSNVSGADAPGFRRIMTLHLRTNVICSAAAAIGVLLFSPAICAGYGRAFQDAVPVVRLLAVAGFLMSLSSFAGVVICSLGRAWAGFSMTVGFGTVLIWTSYVLVPRTGAWGLAAANIVAYALLCTAQAMFLYWELRSDG